MAARRTKAEQGEKPKRRRGRPPGQSPLPALRLAARAAYTLSHEVISVDELAEHPDYAAVGKSRMRQWAYEEDWDARRQQACQAWRQRAEGSLGATFLRRQARQMQLLANLHDEAVRLRSQQVVQPRSWESVANVQLKAADLMRQWSKDQAQALAMLGQPQTAQRSDSAASEGAGMGFDEVDQLTESEARIAAHAVLSSKLSKRLAETDEGKTELPEPVELKRASGGS